VPRLIWCGVSPAIGCRHPIFAITADCIALVRGRRGSERSSPRVDSRQVISSGCEELLRGPEWHFGAAAVRSDYVIGCLFQTPARSIQRRALAQALHFPKTAPKLRRNYGGKSSRRRKGDPSFGLFPRLRRWGTSAAQVPRSLIHWI
jgi:hypothetical protein